MSFDHDQDRPSTLTARALLAAAVVISAGAAPARADIDGDTLTSTTHGVRLELPRGWRASEVSVYPGVVVWLSRSSPRVTILVTVDQVSNGRSPTKPPQHPDCHDIHKIEPQFRQFTQPSCCTSDA